MAQIATGNSDPVSSALNLAQLFLGRDQNTTQSGSTKTTTSSEQVSQEGVQALVNNLLSGNAGLAATAGGAKSAGLYNSSTNQLLINDLISRTAAQGAALNKTSTQTTTASPTTTNVNTPAQVNPVGALGGLALWNALPSGAKDKVGSIFGLDKSTAGAKAAPGGLTDDVSAATQAAYNDASKFEGLGSVSTSYNGAGAAAAGSDFVGPSANYGQDASFLSGFDSSPSVSSAADSWDFGGVGDAVGTVGGAIGTGVSDAAGAVGSAVSDFGSTVSDAASSAGSWISDLFSGWFADGGAVRGYADGGSISGSPGPGTLEGAVRIRQRAGQQKSTGAASSAQDEQDKADEKLRLAFIKKSQKEALDNYKLVSDGIASGASPNIIGEVLSKLSPGAQRAVESITKLFSPIQGLPGAPAATLNREAIARQQTGGDYADGGSVGGGVQSNAPPIGGPIKGPTVNFSLPRFADGGLRSRRDPYDLGVSTSGSARTSATPLDVATPDLYQLINDVTSGGTDGGPNNGQTDSSMDGMANAANSVGVGVGNAASPGHGSGANSTAGIGGVVGGVVGGPVGSAIGSAIGQAVGNAVGNAAANASVAAQSSDPTADSNPDANGTVGDADAASQAVADAVGIGVATSDADSAGGNTEGGSSASAVGGDGSGQASGSADGSSASNGDGGSAGDGGAGSSDGGNYATGGPVRGPGTGISDSINARLSDGEYVIPADVVEAVGIPFLDSLRDKYHTPAAVQRRMAV